jgi:polar amino acid transport system substrate-binding protein
MSLPTVAMTHLDRCVVFIDRYETVTGIALLGTDLLADPDLAYAPILNAKAEPFYLIISRNVNHPEMLKQRLDEINGDRFI